MDNPPQERSQHIHLPRGEVVIYATARPNARILVRDIRNLGYDVWEHHIDITEFQQPTPPQGVLLHSIVLGRVIILFAERDEGTPTSDSSSSGGSSEYYFDSDAVDSETGRWGRLAHRRTANADHDDANN